MLTLVQKSRYDNPVFIITKKEGNVRFIPDYCRIIQQLVGNMYPLTRICKTMKQLEGLQYATTLDQNMGYYTIRLSPASQDMTTKVTEFSIFRYNRLPMGICDSGDIFQTKLDELLGDIKGVKKYIDGITVLRKD